MSKVQQRGKVVAGVKFDMPLFGYLNPKTNKLEGFEIDLTREIARKIFGDVSNIDDRIDYREATGRSRVPMVQEGVIDLLVATGSITDERKQQIDFSDVYWLSGISVIVPKDSPIKVLDDIRDKTVVTTKGTTGEKFMTDNYPNTKLLLMDNQAERLTALQNKRADAYAGDSSVVLSILQMDPSFRMIAQTMMDDTWGIGIQKGHPEFVTFINGILKDVKASGKWKEMYKNNVKVPGDVPEPPK